MVLKFIFVIGLMAVGSFGEDYTPGTDQYLLKVLIPLLNPLNGLLFDGPGYISNAQITGENRNKLPTLEQMQYYMYYAASMYFGYDIRDNRNLTCEYCLKYKEDVVKHEVFDNDVHNTLALITLSLKRKEIVVVFRGTFNVWNVVLDALLICGENSDNPQIKIHQGFYIAVMSLYGEVVKTVASYLNVHPGLKIVIAGHSLGAAMARLMYYFLKTKKEFPRVKYELFTYGEPRVGNKYFAELMNRQPITTARVVARGDIVPHVPPTSVLGTKLLIGDFYIHPLTEFWINGKEGQRFCIQTVHEDPECSMSMGPVYSAVDHLVYFDTNLGYGVGQPLQAASLPFGLLNPFKVLPPLPKPLENLIGGVGGGVVGAVAPALG